jgi:hypothetical protein
MCITDNGSITSYLSKSEGSRGSHWFCDTCLLIGVHGFPLPWMEWPGQKPFGGASLIA